MPNLTEVPAPSESPRLRGVREHMERAQLLLGMALDEKDAKTQYRLMLAAIYSCRALVELMLEAAEKQELKHLKDPNPKVNRNALEEQISGKLPFYLLIERIRIHDFHRFGVIPPDPNLRHLMFGGPIKLIARRGGAVVAVTDEGPKLSTTGNSEVQFQRPLMIQDGEFFDDDSSKYVRLEEVLRAFLAKTPDVIHDFSNSVS